VIFTSLFTFECLLKIIAYGPKVCSRNNNFENK
jgi:hypothetical protein